MRQLAGTKTKYRRAHAAPLARLISERAKYKNGDVLLIRAAFRNSVFVVHERNLWNVLPTFLIGVLRVTANNHKISHMDKPGGRTVEANNTRAAFAADGVRRQAIAVVDVIDINLFPFDNVGCFHQEWVQRDTAFVVQAGVRDCRTMDF
jgi:hypothetical protein